MASVSGLKVFEADSVNPMGTDGFEFVEYTAPDPAALGVLFEIEQPIAEDRAS